MQDLVSRAQRPSRTDGHSRGEALRLSCADSAAGDDARSITSSVSPCLTHRPLRNPRAPPGRRALPGQVKRTPFSRSLTLSEITGATVWLKFENLQFTGSFKERGAVNKLSGLSAAERERGVIAMSAGNHAQGVAYHAKRLGIRATIVMPKNTPYVKVKHTEGHGARVILEGRTIEEAAAFADPPRGRGAARLHPPLRRPAGDRRPGHDRARRCWKMRRTSTASWSPSAAAAS